MAFYKRSTFLINPAFQLKFSLIVCSFIFISSLLYPFILNDFLQELAQSYPEMANKLKVSKEQLLYFLLMVQAILVFIVFILFIFMTHKIAGPMYKLKNHLLEIREGKEITPLSFRNGDYFHDVAEEVTLFLETISMNQEKDTQFLEEVTLYINNLAPVLPDDKKPVLNEISRRLTEIKSRYKNKP